MLRVQNGVRMRWHAVKKQKKQSVTQTSFRLKLSSWLRASVSRLVQYVPTNSARWSLRLQLPAMRAVLDLYARSAHTLREWSHVAAQGGLLVGAMPQQQLVMRYTGRARNRTARMHVDWLGSQCMVGGSDQLMMGLPCRESCLCWCCQLPSGSWCAHLLSHPFHRMGYPTCPRQLLLEPSRRR